MPNSLSAISMKALSLNPADRYDNVDELRDDVIRYKNSFVPTAEKVHIFKRVTFLSAGIIKCVL